MHIINTPPQKPHTPTHPHTPPHSHPAFTIVELLIVIVVIAILAAIAIIAFTGIQQRAAATVLKADLASAARELGLAHADTGIYPGTDDTTTDGSSNPTLTRSPGTTYQYTRTGSGAAYCLTATSTRDGVPAFMITHDNTTPREGTCPGHTGPITGGGGGGTEIANNSPIQDVTQAQCQALPTFTGSNNDAVRTVTDSRGGTTRTYEIAKLADNKCWMLTNLKLGSTTGSITLTPADSDVASNFTLPQLATTGTSNTNIPRVLGPVPGDTGSGTTNYGYFYNWPAASAGETTTSHGNGAGRAPNSICAQGWQLPDDNDFEQLNQVFGGSVMNNPSANDPILINQWISAYHVSFAGQWGWSSGFISEGVGSSWWTSVARNVYAPDVVSIRVSNHPSYKYVLKGSSTRHTGYAVRCVLK